jgi:hypothetical protein
MPVMIDEVEATVEPPQAASSESAQPSEPEQTGGKVDLVQLRRRLRELERRQARLKAD